MSARRLLLPAASAVLCLTALTACEKPAPIVTVVNEGRSVYAEAATWCFEGQTGDECAKRGSGTNRLEVLAGTLGVDVDEELADSRWIVTLVDAAQPEQQLVTSGVREDSHYYSFELPELPPQTRLVLTVRALAEGTVAPGTEPEARGSWQFELVTRS